MRNILASQYLNTEMKMIHQKYIIVFVSSVKTNIYGMQKSNIAISHNLH